MKYWHWLIAFLAVAGLGLSPAFADNLGPKDSIYFGVGGSVPAAPSGFPDNWGAGPSGGVGFDFGLSDLFSIVLDANYSTFDINSTRSAYPGITFSGGPIHMGTFLGNVKFKFIAQDNPVIPYLIFGLGGANFQSDAVTATDGVSTVTASPALSETDFAFRLGVGIDIKLDRGTYLFVESNGVDALVSQKVASEGYMTYDMSHVGLGFGL